MASTQVALAARKGLLAVRASLLNADGTLRCGLTDGTAYSLCPQSIASAEETESGSTETIRCGSGSVFATVSTDDVITNLTLTIVFTAADIEFAVLVAGAVPYFNAGDTVMIGLEEPAPTSTPPLTELHAWSDARIGNARAAAPYGYWHYLWGAFSGRLSPTAVEEGFGDMTISGRVEPNASLYPGSWQDIPDEYQGTGLQSWWRADDVPDPDTDASYDNGNVDGGFVNTPACGS